MTLGDRIPADQPGRSFDPTTGLQARVAVPINREIKADRINKGMPVFDITEYGDEVRTLCDQLADAYADDAVPAVRPADAVIDYETIWSVFSPLVDPHRQPARTLIPLGSQLATLELAPIPNFSQNLLIYGERECGKSNISRSVMESVMRQFTPKDAVIIIIDPLRQQLIERDRLYERGFVRRAKVSEPQGDGEPTRIPPPGYVTTADDIRETAKMLASVMASRKPDDDASVEQLRNRTYFTGPEIYVFIDNFASLTDGYAFKCAFDEVEVQGESVSKLLATGVDLGVHFIVTDSSGFSERVKTSLFLQALRMQMMAPILQLAGQPSSGEPLGQAYHLKPSRWRPGQGRLIVDADTFEMVQTAWLDVDAVAAGVGIGASVL